MSQGAQPITSYNLGAGKPERVKQSVMLLLKVCFVYSMLFWITLMLFPTFYVKLFNSNTELVTYTQWAMRIYFAVLGIFGVQIACQQSFIALGNAKSSVFLALLRKVILLIPLIYILPHFLENKAFAVYLAEPVADIIAVSTTSVMFYKYFKKVLNNMQKKNN